MSKRLIRFDWAVKKLLRNKANFVVLEGFLSELLFEDIKITRFWVCDFLPFCLSAPIWEKRKHLSL